MVLVEELSFFYGHQQVLYDIDLTLSKNSITGLVGPNGAGKSTLMQCIAGLHQPSSGRVYLDGVPILQDLQASFAKIGYLPDFFGLSDGLTVMEHLTYAAYAKGVDKGDVASAVIQSADLLGLGDKLCSKVGQLSRGQRQRVGIGQVIVHRPKLLVLDEPASGLDPKARYELAKLLLALGDLGMTLLVSSHILSELDEYCTDVLVLEDGCVKRHVPLVGWADSWVVAFVELHENMVAQINQIAGVKSAVANPQECTVTIKLANNNKQMQAQVLRAMIAQDLPVCGATLVGRSSKDILFDT